MSRSGASPVVPFSGTPQVVGERHAGPRRNLADFLIGAHALRRGYRLLTLSTRIYRSAFPRLTLVSI